MANLAKSAVTILDSYQGGGSTGHKFSYRRVKATLATQGGTTNQLTAAAFLLRQIVGVTNVVKSDNTTVTPAAPSVDGSFAILANGDVSGDYYFTIWGYPL